MSKDKVINLGAKREHKAENVSKDDELVYCSFWQPTKYSGFKNGSRSGCNICSECAMIAVQYLILNDRMPSAEAQQILDAFWGKARK